MVITSFDVDFHHADYAPSRTHEGVVLWITNAKSASTTEMIWTFDQDLSYFKRYFGLMMDSMMGGHFEKGLLKYKSLMEASK